MDTNTLNEYLFAGLVTRWAIRIALAREADVTSADAEAAITTEDLQAALSQLELRRGVVQALRKSAPGMPAAAPQAMLGRRRLTTTLFLERTSLGGPAVPQAFEEALCSGIAPTLTNQQLKVYVFVGG
jgi:hypothetical protein